MLSLATSSVVIRNRRAALDGLSKIMDAAAPEDLFTGSEDEALFLYELWETARQPSSVFEPQPQPAGAEAA